MLDRDMVSLYNTYKAYYFSTTNIRRDIMRRVLQNRMILPIFQSVFQNFYAFQLTITIRKSGRFCADVSCGTGGQPMDARRESEVRFMVLKGGRGYTIEDIEALPPDVRAELIDGEMFIMEAPGTRHQDILSELLWLIKSYVKEKKGSCRVFTGLGSYIKKDRYNYVIPDISVICDKEKLDEKGCHGAPDWGIEIVSPSTGKRDYGRKAELYRETGMREYWIVDSKKKMVTVYEFEQGGEVVQHSFAESIKAGIYDDLYINFSEMDLEEAI